MSLFITARSAWRCRSSALRVTSSSPRARCYSSSAGGKDPRLSQGTAQKDNLHPNDPQSQSARSGMESRKHSDAPLDAASKNRGSPKKVEGSSGNPEGIGMVDQVGSQSGSAEDLGSGDGEKKGDQSGKHE